MAPHPSRPREGSTLCAPLEEGCFAGLRSLWGNQCAPKRSDRRASAGVAKSYESDAGGLAASLAARSCSQEPLAPGECEGKAPLKEPLTWLVAAIAFLYVAGSCLREQSLLAALPLVAAGELYRRHVSLHGKGGEKAVDASSSTEEEISCASDGDLCATMAQDVRREFSDGSADWVSEATVQRLLVGAEGDSKLARRRLTEAVRWRRDTLQPWLDEKACQEQEQELRLIAFGQQGRPMLYLCSAHQQPEEGAPELATLLDGAISQSPDPLVQIDIVFDTHGFHRGLLGRAGVTPYIRLAPAFEAYFAERVHRVVLVDMPGIVSAFWRLVRPSLPPKTRSKVVLAYRNNSASMEQILSLSADDGMREMVAGLLEMNGRATAATGRHESHSRTEAFLRRQREGAAAPR